jgi:hypothetical protein
MPVLRSEPDNTLAETLGNLGNSLTQSFNPLNMVRSQNLQSEIQQRNWEIQHQQTLDAANRNAADVFVRTFDGILPPGVVASEGARIRAGNGNIENAVNAAKALGTWQGNQAAAKMIDADPEMAGWDAADRESVKARVLNGESLTAAKQAHAQQKLEENKTTQTLAATGAAQTPAAKEAMAIGQPETGVQLDAGNTLLNQPPITGALGDPDVQKQIDRTTILRGQAKIPVTADMPVSSGLAAPTAVADITKHNIEEQAKPRAPSEIVPAVPTTDVLTGQPVPVPQGGPAPVGTVSQAAQGPNTAATAATTTAETSAKEIAASDVKVLDQAMSESGAAQSMKSKLSQLRDLADALDTSGGGLTSRVLRTLAEYNIHPGDIGATYAAIQQIINAEIPDVRQKAGIQRLAGPAIKEEQLILGTANMPRKTLMNIIANEEAAADLQISRAQLAYQARTGQIPMAEYYKQSLALDATIRQRTDELRKQYGAIGTERTRPAPQVPTSSTVVLPTGVQPPSQIWDVKNGKIVPYGSR